MKRILWGVTLFAGGAAGVFSTAALRHQDGAFRPNLAIGPVAVGGMSPDDAEHALRVWWEAEKVQRLKVVAPGLNLKLPAMKPGELGVTIDDVASVKFAADSVATSTEQAFPPVLRPNGLSLRQLEQALSKSEGAARPARAYYDHGTIVRVPETDGVRLDEAALTGCVAKAIAGDRTVVLPLKTGEPKVTADALNQITDVVASYSTRFPTYRRTRCSNIKLASHIIDGTVLLPGEKFSFNDVVGRRTLRAGFKVAGVYINGQHDTGVGGGICQVSTTLYNAALLSDLAIHRRSNHSLPVPYVPLGRDATVDYGNLDLVFENTYTTPIAVTSEYHPGELTFRILGKRPAGMKVEIIRGPLTWAPEEVVQVTDPHLAMGAKKVVKPGSATRSVRTIRVVFMDGKVVKREPLGRSFYGGQKRVVAVGTRAPLPEPAAPAETAPPTVAPPPVAPATSTTGSTGN